MVRKSLSCSPPFPVLVPHSRLLFVALVLHLVELRFAGSSLMDFLRPSRVRHREVADQAGFRGCGAGCEVGHLIRHPRRRLEQDRISRRPRS